MSDTPRQLGDRYEVGELLGRGGMAEVHRGIDHRLGRPVAVKLLRTDLARDPSFQARFRREAQSAASLNHPAIVAVYDTGESPAETPDGPAVPFIVMEFVEGTTLRELMDDGRRLMPQRALEITAGVLEALDYSHRHGIVHRDIKPANVMLTRTGAVKVMDFGIARAVADTAATMTQTSAVIGTAQYLSPEQARGETVDARSDIYSTGCLLYELLTGRPPFVGDSPVSVAYQHVREAPLAPSVIDPEIPPTIDAVVLKSLAKDRSERYQSAGDMRADLVRALSGQPVTAPLVALTAATQRMPAVGTGAASATTTLPQPTDGGEPAMPRKRVWGYLLLALAVVAVFALAAFVGSKLLDDSANAQTVAMAKVVGLSEADARAALQRDGFPASSITATPRADDLPAGTVLEQDPKEGARVDPASTAVTLVVSSGPDAATVPRIVGLPLDEATQALEDAGLKLGEVSPTDSNQPKDQVLSASAREGQSQPTGTAIDVTVASGSNVVPNVVGESDDRAAAMLTEAGFTPRSITQIDATNPPGTVLDQTPDANSSRPLDSVVTLTVSMAPPTQTSEPTETTTAPPTETTSPPPTQTTTSPPPTNS